jgi:hypothetical protein
MPQSVCQWDGVDNVSKIDGVVKRQSGAELEFNNNAAQYSDIMAETQSATLSGKCKKLSSYASQKRTQQKSRDRVHQRRPEK